MTSFTARWCALAALGFDDQDCRYILGGMNDSVAFYIWETDYE